MSTNGNECYSQWIKQEKVFKKMWNIFKINYALKQNEELYIRWWWYAVEKRADVAFFKGTVGLHLGGHQYQTNKKKLNDLIYLDALNIYTNAEQWNELN